MQSTSLFGLIGFFALLVWLFVRASRSESPSPTTPSTDQAPEALISLAFHAFRQWGPIRKQPILERIRTQIPTASHEEVEAWVEIFKEIQKVMWELSLQGGSFKLGDEEVARRLTSAFPFLSGKGLKAAIYDLNWDAWHEGLDR